MRFSDPIDFASLVAPVALRLLGEPAGKSPNGLEWRYGTLGGGKNPKPLAVVANAKTESQESQLMSAIDCGSDSRTSLARALSLLGHGLPCFPCGIAKKPTTLRGFKDATCDPDALSELWKQYPGPLVGVPTGEISGVDILDIDARHGGDAWLVEHKHRLPSTRIHRTRSGGLHLLFQHQLGVRCSAGRIAPGVDVRATGGYVIWWPAAGLPVLSKMPVAAWPTWLCALLLSRPRSRIQRITVPDQYVLKRLVQLIAGVREGQRNELTYWAACRAGEMVASGLLPADAAAAVIAEAATRAGLPRAEAERTARNGVRTTGGVACV